MLFCVLSIWYLKWSLGVLLASTFYLCIMYISLWLHRVEGSSGLMNIPDTNLYQINYLKLYARYMAYIMDTNEEERVKVWVNLLIKAKWFIVFDVFFCLLLIVWIWLAFIIRVMWWQLQGKTVEVGRAHFETETTRFTILDAPVSICIVILLRLVFFVVYLHIPKVILFCFEPRGFSDRYPSTDLIVSLEDPTLVWVMSKLC